MYVIDDAMALYTVCNLYVFLYYLTWRTLLLVCTMFKLISSVRYAQFAFVKGDRNTSHFNKLPEKIVIMIVCFFFPFFFNQNCEPGEVVL